LLLVHGSGPLDMNETLSEDAKPFWQISQYLADRGFVVLRYDKRGVGEGSLISDANVWGNATINDMIEDSKKALNTLIQQPEVDPQRVSIIGHSEGSVIVPRVAISNNSTTVKNIVLMGTVAQNVLEVEYYQDVELTIEYASEVLDKNHTGSLSFEQITNDIPLLGGKSLLMANDTEAITNALIKELGTNDTISIDKQLRPALIKSYENITAFNLLKCNHAECPIWFRSHSNLIPTLSVISNVSKSTSILLLNGENDSQTPVQQAFLLQQRLTDVNHPDHTLITYPNLGHSFYPSSQWASGIGPIQQYVLADLYSWLEAHSGLSHPYVTVAHTDMTSLSAKADSNSTTTLSHPSQSYSSERKLLPTSSHNMSMILLNEVKPTVAKQLGNESNSVSIVVGFISPNSTEVAGYGNISKANNTKVDGNTIFGIASIAKTFTTALLADMVKRGLVNLDDPLEKYLPATAKVPTYNGHKITIENLATHTSGLPKFPVGFIENRTYSTSQIYNFLSNTSLQSEPGSRYNYSNFGVGLLGHALSLRAGITYEQLVKDKILNVLGMDSTGIPMNGTGIVSPLPDAFKSKLAKGHIGDKEVSIEFIPEVFQPSGALYSSANDMLRYLAANMGLIHTSIDDILHDTHLMRHERGSIYSNNTLKATYIGLGWNIATDFGKEVIWHSGATDGYTSFIGFNLPKQVGIIILCSCDEKKMH
jgi:CubicO group peptidase (beta-lactamase class C family)/predicted esterase